MAKRWPGGTHDSFIFQNSIVGTRLEGGALRGWSHLIGDKGYPLTEYLITPLAHPHTEQERRFNTAHTRTRATVERCIGLLKGRWICLSAAGGTLLYTPKKMYIQRTRTQRSLPPACTAKSAQEERGTYSAILTFGPLWLTRLAGVTLQTGGQRQRQRLRMLTGPRIRRAGQVARMPLRIHL
ncbi:putative nuclease HARBI1 isoform 1-T1 [Odontesthes bonariensis]